MIKHNYLPQETINVPLRLSHKFCSVTVYSLLHIRSRLRLSPSLLHHCLADQMGEATTQGVTSKGRLALEPLPVSSLPTSPVEPQYQEQLDNYHLFYCQHSPLTEAVGHTRILGLRTLREAMCLGCRRCRLQRRGLVPCPIEES